MNRLQKIIGMFLLTALTFWIAAACSEQFQTDLDAIDRAAKSVLMLEVYDEKEQLVGTGSGFVIFDNFTLATNYHVIEDANLILAYSDAGNQYLVSKVIVADAQKDIALLEFFSPTDLKPLALASGDGLRRAEPVVTIGSPKGVTNSVSLGNISALYEEDGVSYIQFTAPISPGSSGGALFNNRGEVIGITSAAIIDSQNMNLAVDISEIIKMYGESAKNQRVSLGDYLAPSTTKQGKVSAVWTETGVRITWSAIPGAKAYKIFRAESQGKGFHFIARSTQTEFIDNTVDQQIYYYKVESEIGSISSDITVNAHVVFPNYAVLEELAKPYDIKCKARANTVTITWSTVEGADRYIIYRSMNRDNGYSPLRIVADTTYVDGYALSGIAYYYKISSITGWSMSESSDAVVSDIQNTPTPHIEPTPHNEPKYSIWDCV